MLLDEILSAKLFTHLILSLVSMKVMTIIFSFILLLQFLVQVYFFSLLKSKDKSLIRRSEKSGLAEKYKLSWKIYLLICLAIGFLITSFFAPVIFTSQTDIGDFDFMKTGQIGDTIGGLMNPFIALAGVLITGLAFYVQYKANELQRELFLLNQEETRSHLQQQIDHQNYQIKEQQIESQFYEMLKLHRENIIEMKINGYDFEEFKNVSKGKKVLLRKFEKVTEGRKIFVTMKTELEFIIALYKTHYTLDKRGFEKCYRIFFSGIDESDRKFPDDKEFTKYLRLARSQHDNPIDSILTNDQRKEYLTLKMNFNYKPFSGHASRLGHYFRHLYLAVRSIANSEFITDYNQRMKYLHLLRAQLSNHEQILLFYNWLSGYGGVWEDDNHQFFTEYCMIRNLWWDNLIEDDFIKEKVDFLRNRKVQHRKGRMFEIDWNN